MKKFAVLLLSLMIAFSMMAMGCQKKEEAPKPAETTAPSSTPAPAPELEKKEAAPAGAPEKKEAAPAKKEAAPKKESAGGYGK